MPRPFERRLTYISPGYLRGTTPSGQSVVVGHDTADGTGYKLFWKGTWHHRFGQDELPLRFGIAARAKRSGSQEGYPSEPVIKAVWRFMVDKYNSGDPHVVYSMSSDTLVR